MRILHVITAKFPVVGYGGTERIAYWLGKAQAEMGHEVSYLCNPGSKLPFARTFSIPQKLEDLNPYIPKGTDIVQFYSTPNFKVDTPSLTIIEGNGAPGEKYLPNTIFASENHARRHGWTEFVHNGVDLSEYPIKQQKDSYLLFLAKAKWRVKNLAGSIRIAKAAKLPLHVAGGRAPFWHRGVASHGTIDGEKKIRLIQNARALLFPIIWEEPFGIAVIEALACGTPVIATPRGALPEILTKNCGVLGNSFEELVDGVEKAMFISPEACRARVEEAFSHYKMAEKYLFYYKKILSNGKIREGYPAAPIDADPEKKFYYKNYLAKKITKELV